VLHEPEAGVLTQPPAAGSQVSVVQTLPSLQFTGGCPHCPVAGSQVSVVQGLPSSQLVGLPWHTIEPPAPATQVSPVVHRLLSSHAAPAGRAVPTHCPVALQASETVQPFPSLHGVWSGSRVPTQEPVELQASPVEQELPSSQRVPTGRLRWLHLPKLLPRLVQLSVVQGLPSSQFLGSCRQVPVLVSHESMVQKLRSSQDGQSMAKAGEARNRAVKRRRVKPSRRRNGGWSLMRNPLSRAPTGA
jgi:hypothetical protein